MSHPCDEYLYNAYKWVDGIPKFAVESVILSTCLTCVQAKQTKTPDGPNSTRSGMAFKDDTRHTDYEGLNGETS